MLVIYLWLLGATKIIFAKSNKENEEWDESTLLTPIFIQIKLEQCITFQINWETKSISVFEIMPLILYCLFLACLSAMSTQTLAA